MKVKVDRLLRRILPALLPNPPAERVAEPSLLFPAGRDADRPSDFLLDVALRAVDKARTVNVGELDRRSREAEARTGFSLGLQPSQWPGEHYRLLAGLMQAFAPRQVVEVGTGGGLSALAMKQRLPRGSRITTFDLHPWNSGRPFEVLTTSDFADGSLVQLVGDLSEPTTFAKHVDLLRSADLLFVDGPKDGSMEQTLLAQLDGVTFRAAHVLLVMDDIRLWNLLGTWRAIRRPKLDLTSFGHWCGTGLVEWR